MRKISNFQFYISSFLSHFDKLSIKFIHDNKILEQCPVVFIYGVATFREKGGLLFVRSMCEPLTDKSVDLPIIATALALHAPAVN
jgi:hypothetical protein